MHGNSAYAARQVLAGLTCAAKRVMPGFRLGLASGAGKSDGRKGRTGKAAQASKELAQGHFGHPPV